MSGATATTVAEAVRKAVGDRRLIWFGIRGEDGEPLLQLPQFAGSFAITAPLHAASLSAFSTVTYEELAGSRPDLDRFDVDLAQTEAAAEFRRRLLREVSGRCVVVTYRPASFVSALAFAMAETMTLAGLFKDRQAAFEHKPWVETSLARRGLPMLHWRYVADEQRGRAKRLLADGPLVLRASRTSGGVGIVHADSEEDIDAFWPPQPDHFVAVTRFVDSAVPLNVSGCVFVDGTVKLHPPSVQLIGVESLTDRRFGYCGNDFGAATMLDVRALEQLDLVAREVGRWLHEERYIGAFGVDALLEDETVFFLEVNARFQGSSALSAQIARELDVADLFLDHVAASLGLPASSPGLSVVEWSSRQPSVAHAVVHNTEARPLTITDPPPRLPSGFKLTLTPPPGVQVEPGGVLGRFTTRGGITNSGMSIAPDADRVASLIRASFAQAEPKSRQGVRVDG